MIPEVKFSRLRKIPASVGWRVGGLLGFMGVIAWHSTSCGVKTRLVPPPSSAQEEIDPNASPTPERVCDQDLGICEEEKPQAADSSNIPTSAQTPSDEGDEPPELPHASP